ncbi:MAG: hypothetical protein IJV04_10065, partial [Lachnospiraceae bacterium]|nr:hypothetical protein [Lachnospiraceae bacterium]
MKVKSNKLTVYGTGTGTITLSSTKRGKITYTPKDAKVAKAALKGNNGVITGLKPGTTIITVKDDGGTNYKASTANVTGTVKRPGNPSGLAVKNNKTGTLNISWKKDGNATGHYVEVKSGKKVVKKLTLKKLKTTVPKLKAGSKYTVNVWSYAGSKYSTNARSAKAASKTVTVK